MSDEATSPKPSLRAQRKWHLSARMSVNGGNWAMSSTRTIDTSPPPPHERNLTWSQWLWHRTFHHCCYFGRPPHLKDLEPVPLDLFLRFLLCKILLEVCGAAGAVWGIGEIVGLRDEDNSEQFRYASAAVGIIFLIRFYWHAKHVWQHGHDFPYVKRHHRRSHWFHGTQVYGAKYLLQV